MMMRITLPMLLSVVLMLAACTSNTNNNFADVSGTWRSQVVVTSCTPTDVCNAFGFPGGLTLDATLVISQDRANLNGTYTYPLLSISSPVSGLVGDTAITLSGVATQSLGSVAVNLSGNVSGNTIAMIVTHQITLTDGRSANVVASGTFVR